MLNITKALLTLIILGVCSYSFAVEGESIVYNPATGNYLITYFSVVDNKFKQRTFIPRTKFKPTLNSKFKLKHNELINFSYTLINGRDSQQMIRSIILDPVSSVTSRLPDIPLNAPPGKIMDDMDNVASYFESPPEPWQPMMGYSTGEVSFRISWGYRNKTGGLTPGSRIASGFDSRDLPGIIQAEMYGFAPGSQKIDGEEQPDEEDGGFGQQYFELRRNNSVFRPAAVPAIAVPTPFNAPVLIDRIQTQMHTWIAMQLLDAALSAQLDRYLTAAANAYRLNQPKAAKEHIQTLRKTLKKEHEDADKDDEKEDGKHEGKNEDKNKRLLIDRLAARVLDFNLKYVLKRMGDD